MANESLLMSFHRDLLSDTDTQSRFRKAIRAVVRTGDRVLDLGFTPLARGRALGFAGPRGAYRRLTAIDVSELFDFFVHGEYKLRFCRLVPEAARRARGGDRSPNGASSNH